MIGLCIYQIVDQLDKLSFDLKIVEQICNFRNLGMKTDFDTKKYILSSLQD